MAGLKATVLLSLVMRGVSITLVYAITVYLARLMGATIFGLYAYAVALASIVMAAAQFGLPVIVLRESAKASAVPKIDAPRGRLVSYFVFVAVLSIVAAAVLAAYLTSDGRLAAAAIIALAISVPCGALAALGGAAMQGLGKTLIGQAQELIVRPSLILLVSVGVMAGFGLVSPEVGIIIYALATVVGLLYILTAIVMDPHGRSLILSFTPASYPVKARLRTQIRGVTANLPVAVTVALQMANLHAGLLIVEEASTLADVGVYRAAFQLGQLASLGTTAVDAAIAGALGHAAAAGDTSRIENLARRSSLIGSGIALAVLVSLMIAGGLIIDGTFGPSFRGGLGAAIAIAGGYFILALCGPCNNILVMLGLERLTVYPAVAGIGIHVASALVLVPNFGVLGAGLAAAFGMTVWGGYLYVLVARYGGVNGGGLPSQLLVSVMMKQAAGAAGDAVEKGR